MASKPPAPPAWLRIEKLDDGYLVMAGTGETFQVSQGGNVVTQERILRRACRDRVELGDAVGEWLNTHSELRPVN